ncbi:MAG: hypothetical protein CVV64_20220, partial [Candidatus Wallbacteria bacterium HGW-Wallbacteria-1]
LVRNGGASSQDLFGHTGNLSTLTQGNALTLSATDIGTVTTNSGGTLLLTFNTNATSAMVDEVLASIGYSNSSDNPPASVQIDWTFSDGNIGSQGAGGALADTGSITVNITPVNDAPVFDIPNPDPQHFVDEDTEKEFTVTSVRYNWDISDPDGTITSFVVKSIVSGTLRIGANSVDATPWAASTNDIIDASNRAYWTPSPNTHGTEQQAFRIALRDNLGLESIDNQSVLVDVASINDAPTFNSDFGPGQVTADFDSNYDECYSMAMDPDGKSFVVAGYSYISGVPDFSLARYRGNGTLDTFFGTGGKVTTDFGGSDYGKAVVRDSDGMFILAGYTDVGADNDICLARYNSDGSLDTTFGAGGKVITNVEGDDQCNAITLDGNDKIVVTGMANCSTDGKVFLIRYNTDGSLDADFGVGGKVTTDIDVGDDSGNSVVIDVSGNILVGGHCYSEGAFLLLRYNSSGNPDNTFDTDGIAIHDISAGDEIIYSVTISGTKILAAGKVSGIDDDYALLRCNSDGSADATFAANGLISTDLGNNEFAHAITMDGSGRILAAGCNSNGSNTDFGLIRYLSDGSLDTTFGTNGAAHKDIYGGYDYACDVRVNSDGMIIVAGYGYGGPGGGPDYAVITFNDDGTIVSSENIWNTLGNFVSYTEQGPAFSLNSIVAVMDIELNQLNGGNGDYAGASLVLEQNVTADATDLFTIDPAGTSFTLSGGNLQSGGLTFGSFTSAGGTLTVTFTSSGTTATTALVNEVIKKIKYASTNDDPHDPTVLRWTFYDGNAGTQGSGNNLSAAGTTDITPYYPVNDAPTLTAFSTVDTTDEDIEAEISLTDLTDSGNEADVDGTVTGFVVKGVSTGTLKIGANEGSATAWAASANDLINGSNAGYWTPAANSFGTLNAFTVVARDNGGLESDGNIQVQVTVNSVNDAPTFTVGTGSSIHLIGVSSTYSEGYDLLVQPDGKILVAGASSDGVSSAFALVRYNAGDGSLDTSLDSDGTVLTALGEDSTAHSVCLQGDDKILVAGTSYDGTRNSLALVRYNPDGSLDPGFDTDGIVLLQIGTDSSGYSVTTQPDNRILVAGDASDAEQSVILARYNIDGSPDTSFDTDGTAVFTRPGETWSGQSIAVQSDGKILVAASVYDGTSDLYGLIRFNADGTLDTSFDNDGFTTIQVGAEANLYSMALQSDGRIVLAGGCYNGANYVYGLARLNADGSLDTAFSVDGKVTAPIGSDEGCGITLQQDGKIVVAGDTFDGTNGLVALVRYNTDGTLDTTFDTDGMVTTLLGSEPYGRAVTVNTAGKIYVTGNCHLDDAGKIFLSCYNSDGTLNKDFNPVNTLNSAPVFAENGPAVILDGSVSVKDIELDLRDSGLTNYGGSTITLSRNGGASSDDVFTLIDGSVFTASGGVINSYGLDTGNYGCAAGVLTITIDGGDVSRNTLVADVLSHITYENLDDNPSATVQIDWVFSDGNTGTQGSGGAGLATGSTTVSITPANDPPTFAVNSEGKVTTNLGDTYQEAHAVMLDRDGKVLVAGYRRLSGMDDFAVLRYNLDGTLDNSFDSDGIVTTDFGGGDMAHAMALDSNGKILVAGYAESGQNVDFALARYNSDGTLDTTFDSDGKVRNDFEGQEIIYSIAIASDGKILAAGQIEIGAKDFALVRYNSDGSLDTTFGNNGLVTTNIGENDAFKSMAIDSDGKIVAAGYYSIAFVNDIALIRYNSDGTLDTSFGSGGIVITDLGSYEEAHAMALTSDGKIVVAGTDFNADNDFLLLRYNSNGSLDTTFGTNGVVTTDTGVSELAYGISLTSEGKIVIAGKCNDQFAAARYLSNGTPDNSFSDDGVVVTSFGGYDNAFGVAQYSSGEIVLAGSMYTGSGFDIALARYHSDGTLVTSRDDFVSSLDTIHPVFVENGTPFILDANVMLSDHELDALNGGAGNYAGSSIMISRSSAQGELLFSFNTSGALFTVNAGNLQSNGLTFATFTGSSNVLNISFTSSGTTATTALIRDVLKHITFACNEDNPPSSVTVDWIFSDGNVTDQGTGGIQTTSGSITVEITPVNDPPTLTSFAGPADITDEDIEVEISRDDLLAQGNEGDVDGYVVGFVVKAISSGTLRIGASSATAAKWAASSNDTIMGSSNIHAYWTPDKNDNGLLNCFTAVALDDGGLESTGGSIQVQVTVNAVNDAPGFTYPVGWKTTVQVGSSDDEAFSMVQLLDGRIVLGGFADNGTDNDFALVCFDRDCVLDTSFGMGGKVVTDICGYNDDIARLILQADGKIVAIGTAYTATNPDVAMVRYNTDGSIDTTFGTDGVARFSIGTTDYGYAGALQPDGKILVAGSSYDSVGNRFQFAVARLETDGTLDSTFGTSGMFTHSFSADHSYAHDMALQSDGRILVAGTATIGGLDQAAAIRLNTDGTLDTTFAGDGSAAFGIGVNWTEIHATAVQGDGKILLAGEAEDDSDSEVAIARLNADGTLDSSFGTDGIVMTTITSANDHAFAISLQNDGKILVTGKAEAESGDELLLVRYNSDGTLDATFGTNGKVLVPPTVDGVSGMALALQGGGRILVGGYESGTNDNFSIHRFNSDGSNCTTIETLESTPEYTENGWAFALEPGAGITDPELDSANYDGATVTLSRNGGASSNDVFGHCENLSPLTEGNALILSGTAMGTVTTNSGGILTLAFNASATSVEVDEILRSITYSNLSDTPDATVQINWTFSDGNLGAQGTGGELTGQGQTQISITPVNDSPVLDNSSPMVMNSILEDLAADSNNGTTVAEIIASSPLGANAITDIESDSEGLAISAVDNTLGTWQYKLPAGSWTDFTFPGSMGDEPVSVIGQPDLMSNYPMEITAHTLTSPEGMALDPLTGKLFVADAGNNRVLRFSSAAAMASGADAEGVLGQADFTSGINNRGTGAASANTLYNPVGICIDSQGSLYVADSSNHRILRFDNASSAPNGADAEGVLGQMNFSGYQANMGGATSAGGLNNPQGLSIDSAGSLWVFDNMNARVLRFDNARFKANGAPADGVLGKSDFTSSNQEVTRNGMNRGTGVFADQNNALWVVDGNNRVLRFDNAANIPNGADANGVFGQADYTSTDSNSSASGFMGCRYVVVDSADRLWVSDRENNRVLRFDDARNKPDGASADGVIGQVDFIANTPMNSIGYLYNPSGLCMDSLGHLWISDWTNRVVRFNTGGLLMLTGDARVRFVSTVSDWNGTLDPWNFTFRAWDQTQGTSGDMGLLPFPEANSPFSSDCGTLVLTVQPVNDMPSYTIGADQTVGEDSGPQVSVHWATNISTGPADESAQSVSFTLTNNNNSLFAVQPAINSTGDLSYTTAADANGVATVTISFHDDGGTANDGVNYFPNQTFTITVNPVNDSPVLAAIPEPPYLSEDAPEQTVTLTGIGSGVANEVQTLGITASSSNPGLIPNPSVTYTSPGSTGTLKYTPVADQHGTAIITVMVSDSGLDGIPGNGDDASAQRQFTVTVNPVNDSPTLAAITSPAAINEDSAAQLLNLSGVGTGAANEIQMLAITAVSDNTDLITSIEGVLTGSGTAGATHSSPVDGAAVIYTLGADKYGTALITVTVADSGLDGIPGNGDDASVQQQFTVTVTPVNDSPTLAAISDPAAIDEDAAIQTVNLSGIGTGAANEIQTLTVTASSSSTALIPNPTV